MSEIDDACSAFERMAGQSWESHVSGPERVWMLVYRPTDERRLRRRIPMFETAAIRQGRQWQTIDMTGRFEEWLSGHEYRDEYLSDPGLLQQGAVDDFAEELVGWLRQQLREAPENSVVGLLGAASLFGVLRLSRVIGAVSDEVPGRLLVFFPGTRHDNNYRLLDGHDGWNYLAVPID